MNGLLNTISALETSVDARGSIALSSDRSFLEIFVKNAYNSPRARVEHLPDAVLLVLFYAAQFNMRIAEILEIRFSDHLGGNRFIVRGQKRSRSYTITMPECAPFVEKSGAVFLERRMFTRGYRWYYDWCCRVGIGFTPERNRNVARTHAHRYVTASVVSKKTSPTVAGDILHHRSKKSVENYIQAEGVSYGKGS